jgi:hypothetical protein
MIGLHVCLDCTNEWISCMNGLHAWVSHTNNKYFMYDRVTIIINISCMSESHK